MTLLQTKNPGCGQLEQIQNLADLCKSRDPAVLSFFPGEKGWYGLSYGGDGLRAAISLHPWEEGILECRAFTHPDERGQGHFTALLEMAEQEAGEDTQLCFPVNPLCLGSIAVLENIGAEYWYSEHLMKRELVSGPKTGPGHSVPNDGLSFTFAGRANREASADGLRFLWKPSPLAGGMEFTVMEGEMEAGRFLLHVQSSSFCLSHVLVPENLRGRGLGTRMIRGLLKLLASNGTECVSLQVSSDNPAAMALYKKTGFRISETLSYYLY